MSMQTSNFVEGEPLEERPRPYYPALLAGFTVGLFLLTLWLMGTRYELFPPSEFRAENVIQHTVAQASATRLRIAARRLELTADRIELPAFSASTPDTTAKRLATAAEAYRTRAGNLSSRAASVDAILATRHARRLLWVYMASVDVVICIFVCLFALAVIYGVLRARHAPWPYAAGVLAATIILSLPPALWFLWMWYDVGTPPYALVRASVGGEILTFVRRNDALHVFATSLMMWVGVFAVPRFPSQGAPAEEIAAAARVFAEANHRFRLALYVAAAMLVAYVAGVSSLFQWVLAFVNPEKQVFASVESLANSAVVARGLLASGLLVFGFGATALLVRSIVANLAQRALPAGAIVERAAWAEQNGLVPPDLRHHLKTAAAILAPLATGVLAQLLQSFA